LEEPNEDPKNEEFRPEMSTEARREKFVELAEKRVSRAIKDIRLIGNLSNKGNYSYTEADVRKIMRALGDEIKGLKARFETGGGESTAPFKLS
jgi:hypothetical protein